MSRPIAILLVGLPGSGKSTFRKKFTSSFVGTSASSDDYLDWIAERNQMTYNEVFRDFIKEAEEYFREAIANAVIRKENIIIDRTNLTVKGRAKIINTLKKTHDIYAIVFNISDEDLTINLNSRPGKNIPIDIIKNMKYNYVEPTESEGINYIEVLAFSRNE
jgi:tRNA uridine 5-carbamoylmethylation protein Kti12